LYKVCKFQLRNPALSPQSGNIITTDKPNSKRQTFCRDNSLNMHKDHTDLLGEMRPHDQYIVQHMQPYFRGDHCILASTLAHSSS